ncbi:MAG: sortase [bacterium]|nr:sortase [bacterium]
MGNPFFHFRIKQWLIFSIVVYGIFSLALFALSAKTKADSTALLSAAPVLAQGEPFYPVDKIEIPSLGVAAPLLSVDSTDPKDFKEPLTKGVTLYPSANPGSQGSAIILGHSAPSWWPSINYDWVFSEINTLEQGDEIIIDFQGKRHVFKTQGVIFLDKGEEIPSWALASKTPTILLVSCWPPGINNKRIVVQAEAI